MLVHTADNSCLYPKKEEARRKGLLCIQYFNKTAGFCGFLKDLPNYLVEIRIYVFFMVWWKNKEHVTVKVKQITYGGFHYKALST